MRISFDLDEVLFVDPNRYEIENPPGRLAKLVFRERLRKGTVELIRELQNRGFEVWIYTSSFRSERYLRRLFQAYGVRFDGIVNGDRHNKEVQQGFNRRLPQKLPPHFRISLHIDDEESVIRNSVNYGFRALRVYEPDDEWANKVIEEAERVRNLEERQQVYIAKAHRQAQAAQAQNKVHAAEANKKAHAEQMHQHAHIAQTAQALQKGNET